MPPAMRRQSRPKPGDILLLCTPITATLLIIWSIQHLPQETIHVLGWDRLRQNFQHDIALSRALFSTTPAEQCVTVFRDVVVRPIMRHPQERMLGQVRDLAPMLEGGGEVFFNPKPQAVKKALRDDKCSITQDRCVDGWAQCRSLLDFQTHWTDHYLAMNQRVKGIIREWIEEDGRKVPCPACWGVEEASRYIDNAAVLIRDGERVLGNALWRDMWMECVTEVNELRRQLGYSEVSGEVEVLRGVETDHVNGGLDEEGWQIWPEAMYPRPPTPQPTAGPSNTNNTTNGEWQTWPEAQHPPAADADDDIEAGRRHRSRTTTSKPNETSSPKPTTPTRQPQQPPQQRQIPSRASLAATSLPT